MKIIEVREVTSHIIETDDNEFPTYERYSADCWMNHMGESLEPVYSEEKIAELEAVYQRFK